MQFLSQMLEKPNTVLQYAHDIFTAIPPEYGGVLKCELRCCRYQIFGKYGNAGGRTNSPNRLTGIIGLCQGMEIVSTVSHDKNAEIRPKR